MTNVMQGMDLPKLVSAYYKRTWGACTMIRSRAVNEDFAFTEDLLFLQ